MSPLICLVSLLGVIAAAFSWQALRNNRAVESLRRDSWVRWAYTPQEWGAALAQRRVEAMGAFQQALRRTFVYGGAVFVVGIIGGAVSGAVDGNPLVGALNVGSLGLIIGISVILALSIVPLYDLFNVLRASASADRSVEILLDGTALLVDRRCIELMPDTEATVGGTPTTLELTGFVSVRNLRSIARVDRLMVPVGRETEAGEVVARFKLHRAQLAAKSAQRDRRDS